MLEGELREANLQVPKEICSTAVLANHKSIADRLQLGLLISQFQHETFKLYQILSVVVVVVVVVLAAVVVVVVVVLAAVGVVVVVVLAVVVVVVQEQS